MKRDRSKEWRCMKCGRLLGILRGGRLHIQNNRGLKCIVSLPVIYACPKRSCGMLNELTGDEKN